VPRSRRCIGSVGLLGEPGRNDDVAINEKIEPLGVVVRCIGPARNLEDVDGVDPSGPGGVECRRSEQPDIGSLSGVS
jgi:hypothetical protein